MRVRKYIHVIHVEWAVTSKHVLTGIKTKYMITQDATKRLG